MKKIVFIISHIPDPRMNKRIEAAKQAGEVTVIYWNRLVVDIWNIQHKDVRNIEIKIKANYGKPIRRIQPTIKFLWNAYRNLKKIRPDCVYAGNLDMLICAVLYKRNRSQKTRIIYEIADLPNLAVRKTNSFIKRFAGRLFILFEKHFCSFVDFLVITSEMFYFKYYKKFFCKEQVLFMPNMPDLKYFTSYQKKKEGCFTIGFIGAVRYKKQMEMLIEAAEKADVNVLFAGSILENIDNAGDKIEFYGKYDYNTEIAALYSKADCIYAVYDEKLPNVRLALPNKLYEAIYCELPIIVAENTYLERVVKKWNVGVSVGCEDVDGLVKELEMLKNNKDYYNQFAEGCKNKKEKIDAKQYEHKLKKIFGAEYEEGIINN